MRRPSVEACAAGALLAGLAACGETAPQDAQQAKQVTMRNKHHEDLKALPDNLRRIGLMRAIRDTRNRCPRRVESGVHQGDHEGMALWTARCDDNSQWAIFIAVNGDVQVRNCEEMQQLGLPACQALPPVPGGGDAKAPARR